MRITVAGNPKTIEGGNEMNLPHYHENQKKLHVGTREPRSYYIPASREDLAVCPREISDRLMMLTGDWAFGWYENDLKISFPL